MKYLVLRPFRAYGVQLSKGMVVDESEIRSPYLRRAEGKIVPAVSSFTVPEEFGDGSDAAADSEGIGKEDEDKANAGEEKNAEAAADTTDDSDTETKSSLFKLSK